MEQGGWMKHFVHSFSINYKDLEKKGAFYQKTNGELYYDMIELMLCKMMTIRVNTCCL